MANWANFWDRPNSIYVNDAHSRAHYQRLSDDLLALLAHRPGERLLDYGCGEALAAERFHAAGWHVLLYDASHEKQRRLGERLRGKPGIEVLDDGALAGLAPGSIDAIVVSSVVQYIAPAALVGMLRRWRELLRDGGYLIVADIIAPDNSTLADAWTLLGFARSRGFFLGALRGLVRTFFSDYRRLRRELGLSTYDAETFHALMSAAGFKAERLARNPGPNAHRLGFRGRAA
ncbi:MAG: class I SAM-dependent methyltransferase [Alphaproteobacteria bacterium]